MTNDEAIKWLTRRSVIVIFHEDRIVLVAPRGKFTVNTMNKGISIHSGKEFTLAMSDPGDDLSDVVEAARTAWRESASPVDSLADVYDMKAPPAKLEFIGNINTLLGEITG